MRLDALRSLESHVQEARALENLSNEATAAAVMQIVDVLGSTGDEALQAAICRTIWSLADTDALRAAIADGGGILYVGALLASQSADVQQEAALLLVAITNTPESAQQLVAANGVSELLAMLSREQSQLRTTALQLLSAMCTHGSAEALVSAGGANPLAAELVRSAAVAKGWGGNTADGCRDARLSLTCLSSMASCGHAQMEKVRHAVRHASALPSLVALLGTDTGGTDAAAMALLAQLELSEKGAEELTNTGGIALLCESLGPATAADTRLQAAQTLANLSASAVSAVAIAQTPNAVENLLSLASYRSASDRRESQDTHQTSALTTLANLCALGALPADALRSANAIKALAEFCGISPDPTQRAASVALVAHAAQDSGARLRLAELGVPPSSRQPSPNRRVETVERRQQAGRRWGPPGAARPQSGGTRPWRSRTLRRTTTFVRRLAHGAPSPPWRAS